MVAFAVAGRDSKQDDGGQSEGWGETARMKWGEPFHDLNQVNVTRFSTSGSLHQVHFSEASEREVNLLTIARHHCNFPARGFTGDAPHESESPFGT
jgi:hypothetical protein